MFGFGPYSPIYNPYSSPFYGYGMGMGYATPMLQPHQVEAESPTAFGGRGKTDTSAKIFGIGALAIAAAAIITHGKLAKGKEVKKIFDENDNLVTGFWKRRRIKRAAKAAEWVENQVAAGNTNIKRPGFIKRTWNTLTFRRWKNHIRPAT